ncbi:hypothetical protein AAFN86_28250 [Roseomonas sp. CAU 1739]|uniref:hypothetical protein n=1 Tax=Roseomonas sp. CAU 1739 TaxID=3140364 RepID=UPI00325BBC55
MRAAVAEMRASVLPLSQPWREGVFRQGTLVTHGGATWQAARDTAHEPPHDDWHCFAAAGHPGASGPGLAVRGTWSDAETYRMGDIAMLNGGSFIARRDAPGPCPGEGWQLLASPGKRGNRTPGVVSMKISDEGMLTLRNGDGSVVNLDLYPLLGKIAHARAVS